MKVVVTANKLNRRKSPVTDFGNKSNIVEVVKEGFTFESVAQIENNLGVWHQCSDGYWAWEKGLGNTEFLKTLDPQLREINYKDFASHLDFNWLKTNGIGTTICVIDTGIVNSNEYYNKLKLEVLSENNFTLYHGNFIGGIIAGKKKIIGISEESKVHSIKYKSNGDGLATQLVNFIKALEIILNIDEQLILNVSQGFNSKRLDENFKEEKQKISHLIKQVCLQKNKLIFCAADDNLAINDVLFPACMDECISVGCIDEFSKELNIEVKLDLLSPMAKFTSFNNSFDKINDSGSSYSTAFISAMASCFLSKHGEITKKNFLDELEKSSSKRDNFKYGNLETFQYEVINR